MKFLQKLTIYPHLLDKHLAFNTLRNYIPCTFEQSAYVILKIYEIYHVESDYADIIQERRISTRSIDNTYLRRCLNSSIVPSVWPREFPRAISSFHPFFRGKVDASITRSNRVTETGHCQCQSCLPSFYSSFSFTHRAQLLPASGLAFHFFFFRTMPTLSPAISSIHVEEEAR